MRGPVAAPSASPFPPATSPQFPRGAPLVGRAKPMTAYNPAPPAVAVPTPSIAVPPEEEPPAEEEPCRSCMDDGVRPSIEHWIPTMQNQFGLDDRCIARLRELAQYEPFGYEEANMVMGKLVKAVNDNNKHLNRSAFAHTCIKSAWENVHEKKVQAYARR